MNDNMTSKVKGDVCNIFDVWCLNTLSRLNKKGQHAKLMPLAGMKVSVWQSSGRCGGGGGVENYWLWYTLDL